MLRSSTLCSTGAYMHVASAKSTSQIHQDATGYRERSNRACWTDGSPLQALRESFQRELAEWAAAQRNLELRFNHLREAHSKQEPGAAHSAQRSLLLLSPHLAQTSVSTIVLGHQALNAVAFFPYSGSRSVRCCTRACDLWLRSVTGCRPGRCMESAKGDEF